MSSEPGAEDELEEYLRGQMRHPAFRAAYERAEATSRARRSDPFSAMGEAMALQGLAVMRAGKWLRGCWRNGDAERRLWIVAGAFFAAWAAWGLVWWLA